MDKIAVMGDLESIQGFAALGLDIYPCNGAEDMAAAFHRLTGGEYGVIYLTEEAYSLLEREIRRLDEALTPAVIPIPGVRGNTGIGKQLLSEAVERAVGSDILFS